MTFQKHILVISLFVFSLKIYSQEYEYGRGILLDESLYLNSPKSAPLLRGDFVNLPDSFSIKNFIPIPGSQGPMATCSGWACAYSGRTTLEAIVNNWNKGIINTNVFSPSFVYNQIKKSPSCDDGASLIEALDVLKNYGSLRLLDFEYSCDKQVTFDDRENAKKYKIKDFREIAYRTDLNKTLKVKKSLVENKPVVIAIDCPYSFNYAKEIWTPDSTDYKYWEQGHALTVVSYNDQKFGGAFEVLNSWGKDWGIDGLTWIKYSDFEFFCKYAFELIGNPPDNAKTKISGSLKFILDNGTAMESEFNGKYFKMREKYTSGSRFELFLSNEQPAYIYALSSDLTYKVRKLFPFTDKMSALLPYSHNNLAIPNENSYYVLDEVTGLSYLIFLYSINEVDINEIIRSIENSNGSMWERLNRSVKNAIIPKETLFSGGKAIYFRNDSPNGEVLIVLIEFNHIKKSGSKK